MYFEIKEIKGEVIAFVEGKRAGISNCQDALDLMCNVRYKGSEKIVISKENFDEDFFDLSTGLAGEILQKFSNYGMKIAIYGDFNVYTSKSLKDFIYECNNGNGVYFTSNVRTAIDMLSE